MRTRLLTASLVAALSPVAATAQLAPPAIPGFPPIFSSGQWPIPTGQPVAEYTFSGCAPVNTLPNAQRGIPMCATGRLSIMPVPVQPDPTLPPYAPNNFDTYLQIQFALAPGVRLLPDDDVQQVLGPGAWLRFGITGTGGSSSAAYYAFHLNASVENNRDVTPLTPWTSATLWIDYAVRPDQGSPFADTVFGWTMAVTPLGAAVVTPEPSTWALLGTGLTVLGIGARRRRAV